ncbi:uncharacterized protein LOC135831697 [Planococcus citri]|uniref:uncharacterized protein LOC135831697 n=1 Tax=Planococcus citri TaxID=170843 RepID=UPI0031F844EF
MKCIGCGRWSSGGLHNVPQEPDLRKLWLNACGIDESTNMAKKAKLCEQHFTEDDFVPSDVQSRRRYLKKHAVPSIKVDPDPSSNHQVDYKSHCLICGGLDGRKQSFHWIPVDPNVREQWLRNVGIEVADFNTTPRYLKLCDSHFSEDDFIIHPQSKIRRLRKGALPFAIKQKEPSKSKILKVNSSKTSSAKSKAVVAVSNAENISWVPEKFSLRKETVTPTIDLTSSSRKGDVTLTIDLTSEDDKHANPKTVVGSSTKDVYSDKKALDQSSISSLKKEGVSHTVDSTLLEDVQDQKPEQGLKRKRKKKKVRVENELIDPAEPLELKITKMNSKTSQKSETVSVSSTEGVSDKKAPDQSGISSLKKKHISLTVDSTLLEDDQDPKPEPDLKRKRKKKKVRVENVLTDPAESLESEISKMSAIKTSSQKSETVSISSTEGVSDKKAPDQSSISSLKKKHISITVDSTLLEDVQDPKPEPDLKRKRKKKKVRVENVLTDPAESLESEISKMSAIKTSSQKSETVSVSSTEGVSDKKAPDQSSIFSSLKKKHISLTVDSTLLEDVQDPKPEPDLKRKRKKKKVRVENELTDPPEPLELKISKMTSSNTSAQTSETVSVSSTEDVSDKKAPDHSTVFSSKKKRISLTVESTLEDVQDPKPEPDLKRKRKKKKVRVENELPDPPEPMETKISKMTSSNTSAQTSETVSVSSTEDVSDKKAPDHSTVFSSKKKRISLTVESTLEDVQDPKPEPDLKRKRKKKKVRVENELPDPPEPMETKISKMTSSNTSAQTSETVSVSSTEDVSDKKAPDHSTVFSSKKKRISLTVESTLEDVQDPKPPESDLKRKRKKKKVRLENELPDPPEPMETKISNMTSCKTSSKKFKSVTVSSTEYVSDEKAPEHCSTSSKKEDASLTVESNLEDVKNENPPQSELEKKEGHIRRLNNKISLLKGELALYEPFYEILLEQKLVMKKGKKMIKEILQNLEAT